MKIRPNRPYRPGLLAVSIGIFAYSLGLGAALASESPGKSIYTQGAGGSVPACADCHGPKGHGDVGQGYPAIAGLQPAYVVAQLEAFISGARSNQTMSGIAKGLRPKQMSQVAAYVATLSRPSLAKITNADLVEKGRVLFHYGKKLSRTEWVPACYLCHGAKAQGAGAQFPPLYNQHASYVEAQLHAWQAGNRSNDPNGLMTTVAAKLPADDIKAVAAYLASFSSAPQPVWPYKPSGGEK